MKRRILMIFPALALAFFMSEAGAVSFALDSIAAWGRFPHFCIDIYRWGDKFFNSYDPDYVKGSGYRFNVKAVSDSWLDDYQFELDDKKRLSMHSRPSTSVGAYLTYMAVSVGYDVNFKKSFRGPDNARRRFTFGFDCSRLSVQYHSVSNREGANISRFTTPKYTYRLDIPFHGIDNNIKTLECYYFFNHKKYSQPAAFGYSKIQLRSSGSFYAGFYYSSQKLDFDFRSLPFELKLAIPQAWERRYLVKSKVYCARLGYAYNWVFARHWLLGVSESPIVGIRNGSINSVEKKNSFALMNSLRLSVSWNNRRWFSGISGEIESNLVYDKRRFMLSSYAYVRACVGYRFNIW